MWLCFLWIPLVFLCFALLLALIIVLRFCADG